MLNTRILLSSLIQALVQKKLRNIANLFAERDLMN